MFRIHKHGSDRYPEKFEFRLSHFNASQIPEGWNKLMVSLVSMETGKTVAKTNKATVRNGSCQWSESFKEIVWIAQKDSSKETEEGHLKLVISTGSPRSSVLGEAVLNLSGYRNINEAVTCPLPLKRCAYGVILQLQVQGAIARIGFRDGLRKHFREFRSHSENQMAENDNMDSRSDESDNIHNRSTGSTSSNHLAVSSYHEEPGNTMATPPTNVASGSDSSFYVPPGSTDPAWQYGYLASRTDPNTVTCRLCKKIVKGGVYRFKQHLAHRKGNVAACPKVDEETKNKMIAYLDDVARKKSQKAADVHEMREEVDITGGVGSTKRSRVSESLEQPVAVEGSSRQMTIKDAFSKDHRDRVSSFISKWAYTSAISFNAMTTKNFLQMVEAIGKYGPGLRPPTRYELSGPLLKKAVKEIHDGLQGHRDTWTSSGCSLMTDAWTDKRGRSIINFCVNCTLGTSFLKSIDASNEAHTAEYICKLVEECLNEVGVDKVVQIVADNASANAAAGRLLVTKYPQIWWTPCAAHSIDLALEEISRETKVRSAITKAKRLTVFIYSHTKTLSLMRKFTNKRDIARPGQTRFATTFLTLESLNEKKDKLRLMFSSEEWRNCKWYKIKKGEAASSIVFSPTFWNHTTHAIRVFTPLVRLLRVVDADRRPSMGFVYGGLEEAKREIIAVFNGVESSYKFFVDAIISKTKGRLDTPLHLAAYYLNPFYFYTESHGDPDVVVRRGFKECMEKFYPDLDIQDAITRDELPAYRLGRGDFGKPLAVRQRMINDGNFDPANWWHNHGDDTPHLKALAIKILSLTSSSSGCERNWSTFDSELSISASGSHRSSDSGDSFMVRANTSPSPRNSSSVGACNNIGGQDSIGFQCSAGNDIGFGDELGKSSNTSFKSKASGFQWQESQNSSSNLAHRHMDSSKELLEAAQETIEELRGEARMWEKTARKLKNDLETVKKEFSDQSNHQQELEKELSIVRLERDSIKFELEDKRISSDVSAVKQVTLDSSNSQNDDIVHKLKELEEEVKLLKESNATLNRQLNKTQESNFELLSILQELEETIEKQRVEIASFTLRTPELDAQRVSGGNSMDLESEEACELISKEKNSVSSPINSSKTGSFAASDPDLAKEVEALRIKVVELERDCAELTEENIELLYKFKEYNKDTGKLESSLSNSFLCTISSVDGVHGQGHDNESRSEEFSAVPITIRSQELEKECTNHKIDLQHFKDKTHELGVKLQMSQLKVEEKNFEIGELQKKLENYLQGEWVSSNNISNKTEMLDAINIREMSMLFSEMHKELQRPISRVKSPWFEDDAYDLAETGTSINPNCATLKEKAQDILHNILELDKLLGVKIAECRFLFLNESAEISDRSGILQGHPEYPVLLDSVKVKSHSNWQNTIDESTERNPPYGDSVSNSALKEEIAALKQNNMELEKLINQINNEKVKSEEELEVARREYSTLSGSLESLQQEVLRLTGNLESQISANKILERIIAEIESGRHELETNLSELEQENVHLSERISGLEAQLRYMTNEKESNRLELEDCKALTTNLRNEINKLEADIESQKSELKQRLQETYKSLLEAQEESEFLKSSHSKLEVTIESLIDESSSLQKITADLRRQKLELHDKCTILEVELSKSDEKISKFMDIMDSLESKLESFQKGTDLKEKSLVSQLEVICQENMEHGEKLLKAHVMLKKMDTEKMDEIEHLKQEVALLTPHISTTDEEIRQIGSDAVSELSILRADKSKLENNLQDLLLKVQSHEMDISITRNEYENKLQGMIVLLNASKQSEEMLMDDIGHMRKLVEEIRCKEEKAKKVSNDLELKLKTSEYEKEQLKEDISSLKLHLQRIPQLQEEILSLKSSLEAVKFEKAKVEGSLQLLSGECQQVNTEKMLYIEKMTAMQKALSESEDAKLSKVALEEKLMRLECDLTAREALSAHDAELKNEVYRMRRTNSQYQRKIQCLEEEKDELARRVQGLMEGPKSRKDDNQLFCQEGSHSKDGSEGRDISGGILLEAKIQQLEKELAEALQENDSIQATRQQTSSANSVTAPIGNVSDNSLYSLEAELKEMRERYSEMSLKYAEVQAEKEELVMKLKTSRSQKKWF